MGTERTALASGRRLLPSRVDPAAAEGVGAREACGEGGEGRGTSLEATDQNRSKLSVGTLRERGWIGTESESPAHRGLDSLATTPSHRPSCCSFLKFVTLLTDPHRT